MMLVEALGELVILIDKVANVDAAERVDLREGQDHREGLSVRIMMHKLPVGDAQTHDRRACSDHSPSAGIQLTEATLSNSSLSLTTIACESSSVTICAIFRR